MKRAALVASMLLAAAGLAGCGQKSALYLPGHNPDPPEPMAQPAKHERDTAKPDRADASGAEQSAEQSEIP